MAYRYQKSYTGETEIVIDGWEKGISQSPYNGLADVRNVNIQDIPGAVFSSTKTKDNKLNSNDISYLGVVRTFTADASTDIITLSSSLQQDYISFTLTTTGTLPAGLALSTVYYGRFQTVTTFKISTTLANAINAVYVDITSAGTGTHTMTTLDIGEIKCSAKDYRSGAVYVVDSNNRVWCNQQPGGAESWVLLLGNTLTQGNGNGIAVWQNYLFVFRSRDIDVFGSLESLGTATWSNSWRTLNASTSYFNRHKTLVGSDNVLYWTDFDNQSTGQRLGYIGSLKLATGTFAPGSAGTFTFNNNALDLSSGEEPQALAELNSSLVIGVNYSGLNSSGNDSKIYYWDRVSASFFSPILVPESPIYELVNANNIIYIFVGDRGRVYKTNLSSIDVAFKIPDQLYIPGSTSTGYEGLPLFGNVSQSGVGAVFVMTFGHQARTTRRKIYFVVNLYGATALYSYDFQVDVLQIEAQPLGGYGSTSTNSPQLFAVETLNGTGFANRDEIIWFGLYYSNPTTTYTIEKYRLSSGNDTSNFTSYNASMITDLIPTGFSNRKKTFQQLEYKLDRKMLSLSGLRISYRNAIGETWTVLSTEDFSTYGAISSRVIDFPNSDTEWIQLKIELNQRTVLKQIIIR